MEALRFRMRGLFGAEGLRVLLFGLAGLVALSVAPRVYAAPQGSTFPDPQFTVQDFSAGLPHRLATAEQPQEGQTRSLSSVATVLDWESQARLHHGVKGSSGTLTLSQDGVTFLPTKGATLHWPFLEIQTFDLLTPRRLVITGYENRSWHRHGERKYRFDLSVAMPPDVAAELSRRVEKPVRNGDPNPTATDFATIPARHRTLAGGTNGTLRFGADGIEYVTSNGRGGRSWRWSDIQTLANPDPFHLRVDGYRETLTFELKQPMPRDLFDRLWNQIYARDLNRVEFGGSKQNR